MSNNTLPFSAAYAIGKAEFSLDARQNITVPRKSLIGHFNKIPLGAFLKKKEA